MIINLLSEYALRFFTWLEKFSQSRFWLLKAVFIITVITLCFSFQNYYKMAQIKISMQKATDDVIAGHSNDPGFIKDTANATLQEFITMQIANPLITVYRYNTSWRYNNTQATARQFRLTMPVIGRIFHLNVNGLIILQFITGMFLIAFIIILVEQISSDRVLGLLFALGFGFTYLGRACFCDVRPWFDGMAYFFLLAAMVSKRPWLIGLLVLLASFTDERALVASGLVFVWYKLRTSEGGLVSLKDIFRIDFTTVCIVLAWVLYLGGRYALIHQHGLINPPISGQAIVDYLHEYARYFPFAAMTGIKWFCLFIIMAIILLLKQRQYLFLAFFLISPSVIAIFAFIDSDVTKTITYLFPAVFISLYLMVKNGETPKNLRYITLAIAVLCFLMMSVNVPRA